MTGRPSPGDRVDAHGPAGEAATSASASPAGERRRDRPDWTGRRLELEVGAPAHGGHCVARFEGRVVFVRHALPGERVLAEVTEDHGGSFCRADAVRVDAASPDRVPQPCPVARPGKCGGCDWQHATADAQRRIKAQVVAEQLRRIADVEWPVAVEALPGGLLDWRSRVRMAVDPAGRPGFRQHRGHAVVPVEHCPIAVPGAVEAVADRRWRRDLELEIVADDAGEVHVSELRPDRPARLVAGGGVVVERAVGREWRLSPGVFWQVHPAAADALADTVREWAQAPAGGLAWDLYGGVGLFAAVLAEQVGADGSVLVVESARRSVSDGIANLGDLPQVRWEVGRVERVLGSPELADERPDVVVLDPPRKGAGRAVVDAIADRDPERVVHVACDPAALARDVGLFLDQGYTLAGLRAFDAFPMTHHVECVALLTR
ncbi:23S rRNA m(5)U-1939 methyltransferase [Streptoalloteichus hindustanus]|uniref:23S rRNA m(5)U-1939 methyltransferase n=1 Tax=Streptoalloteichus hindustanus TaxID=2017 RepID=A0A1M5H3D9_STRHI|nr:23S rRNA m(5)U-1939 methyltransferase [Streptoalloteichus hindustanus]